MDLSSDKLIFDPQSAMFGRTVDQSSVGSLGQLVAEFTTYRSSLYRRDLWPVFWAASL